MHRCCKEKLGFDNIPSVSGVPRLPNSRTTLTLVSKVTGNAGQVPQPVKRFPGTACKTRSLSAPRPSRGWVVWETVLSDAAVETISVWDRKTPTLFTRL